MNVKLRTDGLKVLIFKGDKVKLLYGGTLLAGLEKRSNIVNRSSLYQSVRIGFMAFKDIPYLENITSRDLVSQIA